MAQSWNKRSGTVEEKGEASIFVVGEKELVPRCPLQLKWEDEAEYADNVVQN